MDYPTAAGTIVDASGRRQFADVEPGQHDGTDLCAAVFNPPTNEIVNVIKKAGIVPSSADETQLWQAILLLASTALTRTIFYQGNAGSGAATKTVQFTAPSGCYCVNIDAFAPGGGGGAGGGNSSSSPGSGGGAGAGASLRNYRLPVTPGDIITITIEPPGIGGENNGTSGTDGGNLVIQKNGQTVVTLGGGHGAPNSYEGQQAPGAAGGVVTWGNGYSGIGMWGGGGSAGVYISSDTAFGGYGGSPFGGQGGAQSAGSNSAGIDASAYGNGGSGGTGTARGGNGAPGAAWLTY